MYQPNSVKTLLKLRQPLFNSSDEEEGEAAKPLEEEVKAEVPRRPQPEVVSRPSSSGQLVRQRFS